MAASPGIVDTGVLPYQEILRLCGLGDNTLGESRGRGPIQPCRRENVRSASYDLRLGTDFYFSEGDPQGAAEPRSLSVRRLVPGSESHIVLRPNQFVVVSTLEKVCLPDDVIGHLTLKQDILLQGLIMGSQSQIDAGYRGWIYPLLYNLTDRPATLQFEQSIIRLELVRLAQRTKRPYEGDYQQKTLSDSLKHPIGSSLAALREEVEHHGEEVREAQRRLTNTRIAATLGALAAILLPIILALATGFIGEVHDARNAVSRLEGQLEGPPAAHRIDGLEAEVAELKCELRRKGSSGNPSRCRT